MAKITRTQQRRLVASAIALMMMTAIMVPTATKASSGDIGAFGFTLPNATPSPRNSIVRHQLSQRQAASRHSHVIGGPFFSLGANGVWIDNSGSSPAVVVTHPSVIPQQQPVSSSAVVKMPSAVEQGIIVVRGDNKSYVTFRSG